MRRDNFSQLPNSVELQNILKVETKRNLLKGKESVHYFDFSPLIKLAEHFGVKTGDLTAEYTAQDLKEQDLLEKGKSFIEKIKGKLLDQKLSLEDISVCNSVYDYLAEEDVPENTDLIFVFGAKTPLRIEKAVELYNQGISEIMVISGRGPHYGKDSAPTEATTYARIAMNKGVPEKAIIVEEKSITIPDNVRSSLNLLDEKGVSYNSIILINSPYSQRRGWAHFKKYLPDDIKLIRVNCGTGEQYKKDTWYKNPTGIDVICGEYLKAKIAVSLNTA